MTNCLVSEASVEYIETEPFIAIPHNKWTGLQLWQYNALFIFELIVMCINVNSVDQLGHVYS